MPVMQNHAGRTFGRLTLTAPVPGKSGYWTGTCSCGRPVEKRVDNLKRPGDHSCGKCLAPTADGDLEQRVRRLERVISAVHPDLLPGPTPGSAVLPAPAAAGTGRGTVPDAPASRFSNVSYDPEGELWEARTLTGRAFFWGATEQEAAYAARLYLERTHAAFNRNLISDAELTLADQRRREIESELGRYR